MKLNIAGCRAFIERNGIEDYQALSSVLGVSVSVLKLLEQGGRIGYDAVREIYNNLGEQTVTEIIIGWFQKQVYPSRRCLVLIIPPGFRSIAAPCKVG